MAQGISVALPLRIDPIDGAYGLNREIESFAQQNIKTVVLTSPGERIMEPEFGVGIRRLLFEQNTSDLIGVLEGRVRSQVRRYVPFVDLKNVSVRSPTYGNGDIDMSALVLEIRYNIPAISQTDLFLTIPVSI